MIDQKWESSVANREWKGWPNDVQQAALEVIATTRGAWAARGAADEALFDCPRFAHPLFKSAPDAMNNGARLAQARRLSVRRRA